MNLVGRGTYRPGMAGDGFGRLVGTMFEDFLAPLASNGRRLDDGASMPRLDLRETEQAYEVQADMPGVEKPSTASASRSKEIAARQTSGATAKTWCILNAQHASSCAASPCLPRWTMQPRKPGWKTVYCT